MYTSNLKPAINRYNIDAPMSFAMLITEHNCYIHRREKIFYLMTKDGLYLNRTGMTLSGPNGPYEMPEMVFDWLCEADCLAAVDEANTIFDLTREARSIFSHGYAR